MQHIISKFSHYSKDLCSYMAQSQTHFSCPSFVLVSYRFPAHFLALLLTHADYWLSPDVTDILPSRASVILYTLVSFLRYASPAPFRFWSIYLISDFWLLFCNALLQPSSHTYFHRPTYHYCHFISFSLFHLFHKFSTWRHTRQFPKESSQNIENRSS